MQDNSHPLNYVLSGLQKLLLTASLEEECGCLTMLGVIHFNNQTDSGKKFKPYREDHSASPTSSLVNRESAVYRMMMIDVSVWSTALSVTNLS